MQDGFPVPCGRDDVWLLVVITPVLGELGHAGSGSVAVSRHQCAQAGKAGNIAIAISALFRALINDRLREMLFKWRESPRRNTSQA